MIDIEWNIFDTRLFEQPWPFNNSVYWISSPILSECIYRIGLDTSKEANKTKL